MLTYNIKHYKNQFNVILSTNNLIPQIFCEVQIQCVNKPPLLSFLNALFVWRDSQYYVTGFRASILYVPYHLKLSRVKHVPYAKTSFLMWINTYCSVYAWLLRLFIVKLQILEYNNCSYTYALEKFYFLLYCYFLLLCTPLTSDSYK